MSYHQASCTSFGLVQNKKNYGVISIIFQKESCKAYGTADRALLALLFAILKSEVIEKPVKYNFSLHLHF